MKRGVLWGALLVLLAGCGPRLTPILAERQVEQDAVLNHASTAQVGESLLSGLDMFSYDTYSPREVISVPVPDGTEMKPLSPDQSWIAYYRLDEDTLVIEAPGFMTKDDVRLGLSVDSDGRVKGNRPWFDLRAKHRLNQPSWKGRRRYLFRVSGAYLVDSFAFDLRYEGVADGRGVFGYRDFKQIGVKASEYEERVIGENQTVTLHGFVITVIKAYPDHVRYMVESAEK